MDVKKRHPGKNHVTTIALAVSLVLIAGTFQSALAFKATLYTPSDPMYMYTVEYDTLGELITELVVNPPNRNISFDQNRDEFRLYTNVAGTAVTVTGEAGSPDITVSAPDLGFTKVFTGASRSEAVVEMQTWGLEDPDGVIAQINNQIAIAAAGDPEDGGGCFLSILK